MHALPNPALLSQTGKVPVAMTTPFFLLELQSVHRDTKLHSFFFAQKSLKNILLWLFSTLARNPRWRRLKDTFSIVSTARVAHRKKNFHRLDR